MNRIHAQLLYWFCLCCIAMAATLFVVIVAALVFHLDDVAQPMQRRYGIALLGEQHSNTVVVMARRQVERRPEIAVEPPAKIVDDTVAVVVSGRFAELGAAEQIEVGVQEAALAFGSLGATVTRAHGEQFDGEGLVNALAAKLVGHKRALIYITTHGIQLVRNRHQVGFGLCLDCDADRMLLPSDLKRLLDYLQQHGTRQIVVVIEACYSGSAIETLRGKGRTIVTSSGVDDQSMGGVFSREFLRCLSGGMEMGECFNKGRQAVVGYGQSPQMTVN